MATIKLLNNEGAFTFRLQIVLLCWRRFKLHFHVFRVFRCTSAVENLLDDSDSFVFGLHWVDEKCFSVTIFLLQKYSGLYPYKLILRSPFVIIKNK